MREPQTVRRSMVSLVLVLLAVGHAVAQARPDFSGTWAEDETRRLNLLTGAPIPKPPGGAPVLPPSDTMITQTAESFTTERKAFSTVVRYVYQLDGRESRNFNGADTVITRSRWEGGKLITEGTRTSVTSQGENTWDFREVRYLDSKGTMVVETTHSISGKPTHSARVVYVRKKS